MAEEKVMQNIDISDFGTVQTLRDEDYVVISLSEGVSAKASVYLLKALFTATISPNIRDGVWYVGEKNTEVNAEGLTPQFRKGATGIEYKYSNEGNTAWRPLVPLTDLAFKFEDLTQEQRNELALTFDKLTEEEIEQLQQPAKDMIAELERVNAEVAEAETARVEAESARDEAETTRQANEDARIAQENARVEAEANRATDYANIRKDVVEATENANSAATESRNTPIIRNGTWWVYSKEAGDYADTGTPAVAQSPQIVDGKWWVWDEESGELVNSGVSVGSDYDDTELRELVATKQDKIEDLDAIRAGAALGATALQEHQDISGKLDKIEAEETYATKTEVATKQDKNTYYTNIEAATWVEDSTYTDFAYRCDLACEGVTPNDYAEVVFEVAQSTSGEYAPVCETIENAVRIWSASDRIIIVPTIIVSK